jgi:tetratricopeptide (TPR) repeat protein
MKETIQVTRKRYCFILGAGASRASGIQSGADMAEIWWKELHEKEPEAHRLWLEQNKITADNAGEHYSALYAYRFRLNPVEGYQWLKTQMRGASPSLGYYYLAQILANANTANNFVVTTNFDSLMEDSVFMYTEKKPLVIVHENVAESIELLADIPTVIKIHRDLLFKPESNIDGTRILKPKIAEVLRQVFSIYTPIVIGYGGNDGSMMGFLKEVFTANAGKQLYWCTRKEPNENGKVRKLLDQCGGFWVPIKDFDTTMYLFGKELGHNFSEDAERNKLDRRIKEYREKEKEIRDKQDKCSPIGKFVSDSMDEEAKKRIAELTNKIQETPNNAALYYERGNARYMLKQYNDALDDFNKAISLDGTNADYYLARGKCYTWPEHCKLSLDDYTQAISLGKNESKYYSQRARSYYRAQQYRKALDDFQQAVRLNGNIEVARDYAVLARSQHREGYENEALESLDKAFAIDNGNSTCYVVRGTIRLEIARRKGESCDEKVFSDLNRGVELHDDPKSSGCYRARGRYYMYMHQYPNALKDLTKAVEIEAYDRDAWDCLSQVHEGMGNSAEQKHCLAKVKELDSIFAQI